MKINPIYLKQQAFGERKIRYTDFSVKCSNEKRRFGSPINEPKLKEKQREKRVANHYLIK